MQPNLDIEQMAPDLIGAGAKAIVDNATRLGLTWTLTLATITRTDPLEALADGDISSVGMTSMIGNLFPSQRVYVIQVPPSGNYVVGLVNANTRSYYGIGKQTGTLGTTGVEAAIIATAWAEEPNVIIGPQQIVKVTVNIVCFPSTATNSIAKIRLRRGSVSTTGTLLCVWQIQMVTAANTSAPTHTLIGYFKNTSASEFSGKLSVTLATTVGAANVSVYSDAEFPLIVEISPHSMIGVDSSFDARLVSIA